MAWCRRDILKKSVPFRRIRRRKCERTINDIHSSVAIKINERSTASAFGYPQASAIGKKSFKGATDIIEERRRIEFIGVPRLNYRHVAVDHEKIFPAVI